MKLDRIHIRIMISISHVGFAKREDLFASYPREPIFALEEHGYIQKSVNGHYYNTKLAANFFSQFLAGYSKRLKVDEMVQLLTTAPAYVVVDIETTDGSCVRGAKIIEIAALKVQNGKTVAMFHQFINPEIPIKNSHIHGITNERVKNEETIRTIIHHFKDFLGDLPIVSHHIGFDWYSFLAFELFRNGIRPTNPAACTVLLSRKYLNSSRNSLNIIAETYNIPLLKHHTADADVICANEILQLILSKIKG